MSRTSTVLMRPRRQIEAETVAEIEVVIAGDAVAVLAVVEVAAVVVLNQKVVRMPRTSFHPRHV